MPPISPANTLRDLAPAWPKKRAPRWGRPQAACRDLASFALALASVVVINGTDLPRSVRKTESAEMLSLTCCGCGNKTRAKNDRRPQEEDMPCHENRAAPIKSMRGCKPSAAVYRAGATHSGQTAIGLPSSHANPCTSEASPTPNLCSHPDLAADPGAALVGGLPAALPEEQRQWLVTFCEQIGRAATHSPQAGPQQQLARNPRERRPWQRVLKSERPASSDRIQEPLGDGHVPRSAACVPVADAER